MKTARCRRCQRRTPLDQFGRTKNDNRRQICIVCEAEEREKRKVKRRTTPLKVSVEEYERLLEAQHGRCAICGKFSDRALHLDHDHETGRLRALLCGPCNVGLGMFQDDPRILRKAVEYLVRHQNLHQRQIDQERRDRRRSFGVDRVT